MRVESLLSWKNQGIATLLVQGWVLPEKLKMQRASERGSHQYED